jgi:osmotically-inducible protein OsmY
VGAGTIVAMDRRSASVVQSDQGVEQKIGKAVVDRWPPASGVHVNVTSYGGKVLLTGEVPTQAIRDEIEKIATVDAIRPGR